TYARRQEAGRRLTALPPDAMDEMLEAYRASDDAEVRRHIRLIASPEVLRRLVGQGNSGHGFLGIAFSLVEYATPDGKIEGVLVTAIVPGSPAERDGLRTDDLITDIGPAPVTEMTINEDVSDVISAHPPGQTIRLRLLRDGRPLML